MNRLAAIALGLFAALLALMPLRIALSGISSGSGLGAAAVSGTIWKGQMLGAAFGGTALGDISFALQPLSLFQGRAAYALDGTAMTGQLWRGWGGAGVRGLSGQVNVAGALPIGLAQARAVTVTMAGDQCRSASGEVQVQPQGPLAAAGMLSGTLACDNGILSLPLASADGRSFLDIRLGKRQWTARLRLTGLPPERVAMLEAAGLRAGPDGLAMTQEGRW
ncbi:type II secretion system protein N [Sandarakinorhabdus sp.]|uniref:type II secretion system protein N n=1 Tax=Sandarakinorhabdus sp. TaxID=1916663 RepID=UPI00286E3592|nr:type II secretion system protein N [Sandarakinorhabdus sp.]